MRPTLIEINMILGEQSSVLGLSPFRREENMKMLVASPESVPIYLT